MSDDAALWRETVCEIYNHLMRLRGPRAKTWRYIMELIDSSHGEYLVKRSLEREHRD